MKYILASGFGLIDYRLNTILCAKLGDCKEKFRNMKKNYFQKKGKMMHQIFKAMSVGMAFLSAIGESLEATSDEGENISQREYVRISLRGGLAALKTFGKEITNTDEDIIEIIKEEIALLDIDLI